MSFFRNKREKSKYDVIVDKGLPVASGGVEVKTAVSIEGWIALVVLIAFFGGLGIILSGPVLIDSAFSIAYNLLIDVCFFIMSMAVLMGGLAAVLSEFGIVAILNHLIAGLMKPIYDLPGAGSIAIVSTFLSDNPAVLSLSKDKNFSSCFKKYQMPALTNLGTSFGMGLMVIMFILRIPAREGDPVGLAALTGLLGAVIGSVISTRLMLRQTKKIYGTTADWVEQTPDSIDPMRYRVTRQGSVIKRLLDALLEGGKTGVDIGLQVIPGVLIICTIITLLTNSPTDTVPGVGLLPAIGEKLQFIINPLLGFESPEAITVPITALGSAGASLGLISNLYGKGLIQARDLAVMSAMCMCWSGYLSTHVAMMDSLGVRELTGKAIVSHTIGGFCAGVAANYLFRLALVIF